MVFGYGTAYRIYGIWYMVRRGRQRFHVTKTINQIKKIAPNK
jgi:hypothetical protein